MWNSLRTRPNCSRFLRLMFYANAHIGYCNIQILCTQNLYFGIYLQSTARCGEFAEITFEYYYYLCELVHCFLG